MKQNEYVTGKVIREEIKEESNEDLKSLNSLELIQKLANLGIEGIGPLSSAKQLGEKYKQKKFKSNEERIETLIQFERTKNFTTGFLTSLGGFITLPVAIPSALGANWVLQTRMSAAIAHIIGFQVDEAPVRMLIMLSLLGPTGEELLKSQGVEVWYNFQKHTFHNLPLHLIAGINRQIGLRLIKKTSTKGITHFSKAIPLIGGVLGGMIDWRSCNDTAIFAKKLFQQQQNESF